MNRKPTQLGLFRQPFQRPYVWEWGTCPLCHKQGIVVKNEAAVWVCYKCFADAYGFKMCTECEDDLNRRKRCVPCNGKGWRAKNSP